MDPGLILSALCLWLRAHRRLTLSPRFAGFFPGLYQRFGFREPGREQEQKQSIDSKGQQAGRVMPIMHRVQAGPRRRCAQGHGAQDVCQQREGDAPAQQQQPRRPAQVVEFPEETGHHQRGLKRPDPAARLLHAQRAVWQSDQMPAADRWHFQPMQHFQ